MTQNENSVAAASAALTAHQVALGIEGPADIQLQHLLYSLIEFAGAKGVDFDEVVSSVQAEVAAGQVESPAWQAYVKANPDRVPSPADMLQRVERWMSGYGTKSQSEMRQDVRQVLARLKS